MSGVNLSPEDLVRNYQTSGNDAPPKIRNTPLVDELPSVQKLVKKLKSKPPEPVRNFDDGLCGALLPQTQQFVASPNCDFIPQPPLGSTRDLYRRIDARYASDDPICWPQPYNVNYPFLAAIPKRPENGDCTMWLNLTESDMEFTEQGAQRREGVLKKEHAEKIRQKLELQEPQIKTFLEQNSSSLLPELQENIRLCFNHISRVSSSLYDLQRGLTEVQRGWLMIQAYLDFKRDFSRRGLAGKPSPVDPTRMGCFVWNDRDAGLCFSAGLPVWYIRPYTAFDRQVIQQVVEVKLPIAPLIETAPADPPYPPLLTSQAGSDQKFGAIRRASINCFEHTHAFQNDHLPGSYSSSFVLGQSRVVAPAYSISSATLIQTPLNTVSVPTSSKNIAKSKHNRNEVRSRKPGANPPKNQRDIFGDFPPESPFSPAAIRTWLGVNKLIAREGIALRPKVLPVPDPGLFFGLETEARQATFLSMWRHFRPAWLRKLAAGASPLSVDMWRKILAYPFLKASQGGQSKQAQIAHEARTIVEDVMKKYDPHTPLLPPATQTFDATEGRQLIRELSIMNFQYELSYVDSLADRSKPIPSRNISVDELETLTASHRRGRRILINEVLGVHSAQLEPPPKENRGVAATEWKLRYVALKSLWSLLDTWPGTKHVNWKRGIEMDLFKLEGVGREWERILTEFYARSVFGVLNSPATLPHRI
ncbi:hypothetical protein BDP27DRAFT_1455855 [Rhodocollybia butyracea]|uniref:Uncharacterized protein n=1 Tax=Rhodocollybia butyracea TaxID=206335 RepID=A0A9P5P4T6_9AGAR|nr:hypothetical protein BDP27DRAFT_1455855 [Rhodocollybia butyracea]